MPAGGANNPVNIQNGLVGNLKVNNFDNGQGAASTSFWRGDGHWSTVFNSAVVQTNQNGAIGPLNLLTGTLSTSVLAMVAYFIETTTADGAATTSWQLTGTNTDDSGLSATTNLGSAIVGSSHTTANGIVVIRVKAGTIPSVSVTSSGSAATSKYALYVAIQQLI